MIILLSSPGAKTQISVVDGIPNLRGYTDPALSILQAAFNAGDYEIIPDPEPVVEQPVPDWKNFYDQLIVSQTYDYLLNSTVSRPSISGVMSVMGFAINDGKSDPANPNRLAALQASITGILTVCDAINLQITPEMLSEVRQLLDSNGFESITLN